MIAITQFPSERMDREEADSLQLTADSWNRSKKEEAYS